MERISTLIISKFSIKKIALIGFMLLFALGGGAIALAQVTSNFQQTINAGTLSVDITNDSYTPVGSPSVAMNDVTFSFTCQTATGTLGTTSEQIYIVNPNAANNGFTISLAASDPTDLWDSAGTPFDFNDPTSAGCDGGQMTVNPAAGTVNAGACSSCDTTGLTLGSSAAFSQGVLDSITVLTASAGSDDIGDWYIRGIGISQTIPAEQPVASDYNIDLTLSIVAS
jgi:hypothetical protein